MSLIFLQKTQNRKKFVQEVFTKAEIKKELVRVKRVLLKPNIVSFEPYPTTTHPEVLEACLEFILNLDKKVLVGDGPAPDAGSSKKIIETHPLREVCTKFGLPLIDLSSGPMKKIKTRTFELNFSTIPFEVDYIISLPVLKSHGTTGITGALKNQFGLISPKDRIILHVSPWKDIHKAIAEINLIIKSNCWIVDAIQTLIDTNEIRHGGKIRELGYMLAGKDPVALDLEGLKLLQKIDPKLSNKKPEDIPHLKYAINLDVGRPDYLLKEIQTDSA